MLGPVALGVMAVGAVGASVYSSEKARKEQKAANRVQEKISSRETQKQRVSQFREAQIARAQTAVAGEGAGISGSSSLSGVEAGITSQAASNIQFINSVESLRQEIQRRQERASSYMGQAQVAGAIGSIAGSFVKAPAAEQGGGGMNYSQAKSMINTGGS